MSSDVVSEQPVLVDRRAQRLRAAGEAEQAHAAAEAVRVQTQQRLWEMQLRQAEQLAEARRRDRAARRREKAETAAQRAARMRTAVRAVGSGLPEVAGAVACVAPTLIATRGQYQFAVTEMQLGPMAVLVPLMLEGAAWMLAWRRHQALRAGKPTGRLTAGVWALALTAAALNVWHGSTAHSLQVGVAYGVASLVGFGLVELLAGHQRSAQAGAGGVYRRAWLLGLLRTLRYPRLSWAAWSRRIELGPGTDPATDAAEAWRQAWIDRFDVAPGADARARRHGRRRVKQDRRSPAPPPVDSNARPVAGGPEFRSPALPSFQGPDLPAGAGGPARPGPDTNRPGPDMKRRPGPAPSRGGPARTRTSGHQAARPGPAADANQAARADQTGPSDAELLARVREMAQAGGRPSRNEVVRELGVGKNRATRLLDQLDGSRPEPGRHQLDDDDQAADAATDAA